MWSEISACVPQQHLPHAPFVILGLTSQVDSDMFEQIGQCLGLSLQKHFK